MFVRRPCHITWVRAIGLALTLLPVAGCGGSGTGGPSKPIYKSPDEVNQKKSDLQDAMKGGAYGSAGRKSAPNMGP